jgi:mediator of replication checkpoint protein 1
MQQRTEARRRKRAEIDILFEDEAAESDDDDMFGFTIKKPDDEEDGEDLDQNLSALVDDQKMDAATEAVDLVLDKYK